MHQLTKLKQRGPWSRFIDRMILDEYIDWVGSPGPGLPVLSRPDHYLSNETRDDGRSTSTQEVGFPDNDLSVIGSLLELGCIDEPTAVRLYMRRDDPAFCDEPALYRITLPDGPLYVETDRNDYQQVPFEELTVDRALVALGSDVLYRDDEKRGLEMWGPVAEPYGEWNFVDRAMEFVRICRLHLALAEIDSNNAHYEFTRWDLAYDIVDWFDSSLFGGDVEDSYALAHDEQEEPPLRITVLNRYKGGGFSCMN